MSARKIAAENVEQHRLRDMAACADTYLLLVSCPGGRPIVKGFICPHCELDPTLGKCGGVKP